DDTVVRGVSHALYGQFRRLGRVELESEIVKRGLGEFGCVGIGADQRSFVTNFEEIHFFRRVHFLFLYSASIVRPLRSLVVSPRVFLSLSMPRETTPLFVQYSSAVSSVIRPCSESSIMAMPKVFQPYVATSSMLP